MKLKYIFITQLSINKNYSAYKPIELENTINSLWKERELLDKVDALHKGYEKEVELTTSDKKLLDKLRELGNEFKKLEEKAYRQTKQEKELKDRQLKLFNELDGFYDSLNEEVKEFIRLEKKKRRF